MYSGTSVYISCVFLYECCKRKQLHCVPNRCSLDVASDNQILEQIFKHIQNLTDM